MILIIFMYILSFILLLFILKEFYHINIFSLHEKNKSKNILYYIFYHNFDYDKINNIQNDGKRVKLKLKDSKEIISGKIMYLNYENVLGLTVYGMRIFDLDNLEFVDIDVISDFRYSLGT